MGAERDDPLFSCQGPLQMLLALNSDHGTNLFLGAMKGAGSLINALGEVSPRLPGYGLSPLPRMKFFPHNHGEIFLHALAESPKKEEGQSRGQRDEAHDHAVGDPRQERDKSPQTIFPDAVAQPVERFSDIPLFLLSHGAPSRDFLYTLFGKAGKRKRIKRGGGIASPPPPPPPPNKKK